jgi:predicted GNAT family N-acyltransferase
MSAFTVRRAEIADADAISAVLIASITELCAADHGDDPAIIARWTANKTPDHIRRWFQNTRVAIFIAATPDQHLASVGAGDIEGRILLNYVNPENRGQGVSRAILKALETFLAQNNVQIATLTATRTAKDFYLRAGWQQAGPEVDDFGFPGIPMRKSLQ